MPYQSTKTFGHERGLSCCFRQWRAESHCRLLHGYSLGFKFTFGADELDHCGWVVDFGGLKDLFSILEDTFDHTLLVAEDDPWLEALEELGGHDRKQPKNTFWPGVARIVIVPATGAEAFASMVFEVTEQWLKDAGFAPRCWLVSVEVMEHGANSAIALADETYEAPQELKVEIGPTISAAKFNELLDRVATEAGVANRLGAVGTFAPIPHDQMHKP